MTAFERARPYAGKRETIARRIGVNASTLQVLEGKRPGPLSEEMIDRLTVGIGWPPGLWRKVATGEVDYPFPDNNPTDVDPGSPLAAFTTEDLVRELARRTGVIEQPPEPA